MSAAKEPEWKRLQRRVFTRWLNMKLRLGRADVVIKEDELVTSWGDGYNLVALIQVLSGQEFPKKLKKAPKMRIHQVDQVNRALTFAFSSGVEMELKPSAENLVDGEERQVMGMVWAIMRSFLNFGEDDQLSVQEALLLWVNNQVSSYGLKARNFGKDWHSGELFCALIHKYRPDLIGDWPPSGTPHENIKLAMDGAEKWFGLEQYLGPEDIEILDDKSMLIYVSEYYYGITGFRKQYLAADRIGKLIQFNQRNDELKNEYNEKARRLRKGLAEAATLLGDDTIDNTYAGAKKRLQEFDHFKNEVKGSLVDDFLSCESLFNEISMRLADQKRPEFKPDEGLSIPELREAFDQLEAEEKRRVVALHAEVARQENLIKLNQQHKTRAEYIQRWGAEKTEGLADDGGINSVGEASFALTLLKAHHDEAAQVKNSNVSQLKELGEQLAAEQYEGIQDVQAREQAVDELFEQLDSGAAEKQTRLEEALAREQKFDALRQEFAIAVNDFVRWAGDQATDLPNEVFGETLAQLETFGLEAREERILKDRDTRRERVQNADAAIQEAGVEGNNYTQRTTADADEANAALETALQELRARYEAERERLTKNDELCKDFAAKAEALVEEINTNKDEISNSQAELEDQLTNVQAKAAEAEALEAEKLVEVNTAADELAAAGIQSNPHTLLTKADVATIWQQYRAFLTMKGKMIEDAVEHKKMRGVSPEVFEEIKGNFKNFDKDNSGSIDAEEFKQALYSLGENKSKEEIQQILDDFGNGKEVTEEGFIDYMISVVGANTSKEGILDGFHTITNGAPAMDPKDHMHCFNQEQKDYLQTHAPKTEDGLIDFRAWVEEEFSK